MRVGTHTVNACRSGVHTLMPDTVNLVSGPGCPVCVTAQRYIDALVDLGRQPSLILATYGDMLRVAGQGGSLELARSEGADVRVVTSTLEALGIARRAYDLTLEYAKERVQGGKPIIEHHLVGSLLLEMFTRLE